MTILIEKVMIWARLYIEFDLWLTIYQESDVVLRFDLSPLDGLTVLLHQGDATRRK